MNEGGYAMRHMEIIPDDLQCAFALLLILLLLILAFLAGAYLANRASWHGRFLHDPLTKGMKLVHFQNRVKRLLDKNPAIAATLVLLNIDHFQRINHRYGMQQGDAVLRLVYKVLHQHLGSGEFLARGEGDSFFLFLRTRDEKQLQNRIDEMQKTLTIQTAHRQPIIRLRQGACLIDGTQRDVAVLLDRAKLALRQYVSGKGCVFYSSALLEAMQYEELLSSLFESSLRQHDFQLYLQPKVTLKTNRCRHAEALVRWQHPRMGTIYPSSFIPVFEKNGNILELDRYMFEEVCRYLQACNAANKEQQMISINVSRRHFQNPAFLAEYAEIKERYGIADGQIELELTESIFFNEEQIALVKQAVHEMHQLGFRCSLDDFGSGFSSLGLLKSFDVDAIKLDRVFFEDIEQKKTQDILHCLFELAHRLHIQVVAEGIETKEQLAFLRTTTCDMVQGYYYARPLPAAAFTTWLQQFHTCREVGQVEL